MVRLAVGAGGWSYYWEGPDKLAQYAKSFNAVEVNSTYYWPCDQRIAKRWRHRVNPSFKFTVRCHRDVAERFRFSHATEAAQRFLECLQVCRTLNADVLHILLPSSICEESLRGRLSEFLLSFSMAGVDIAAEIRGNVESSIKSALLQTLADLGIVHCVDLLREKPSYEHEVLYSRIFGKGWHNLYQPDDADLVTFDDSVESTRSTRGYAIFHTLNMYTDAQRFKLYHNRRVLAPVTRFVGVKSALSVLADDVVFPVSRENLIAGQGWKLCDWTDNKRIRVGEVLARLPQKVFVSLDELEHSLAKATGSD